MRRSVGRIDLSTFPALSFSVRDAVKRGSSTQQHLLNLGHRRFTHIGGEQPSSDSREGLKGLPICLDAAGVRLHLRGHTKLFLTHHKIFFDKEFRRGGRLCEPKLAPDAS